MTYRLLADQSDSTLLFYVVCTEVERACLVLLLPQAVVWHSVGSMPEAAKAGQPP